MDAVLAAAVWANSWTLQHAGEGGLGAANRGYASALMNQMSAGRTPYWEDVTAAKAPA